MATNTCLKCGRESWTMARDKADRICRGHDTYGCVKVQRDNLIAEVAKLKGLLAEREIEDALKDKEKING